MCVVLTLQGAMTREKAGMGLSSHAGSCECGRRAVSCPHSDRKRGAEGVSWGGLPSLHCELWNRVNAGM